MSSSIKVTCRNCGTSAPSDQFKLHYELRQVVCPSCFKGGKKRGEEKKEEPAKPPGWDGVDDYLQKIDRNKEQEEAKKLFKRIPGTDYVRYVCTKCKYGFKYDPFRKKPRTCPYCNHAIPKLRTFSLL